MADRDMNDKVCANSHDNNQSLDARHVGAESLAARSPRLQGIASTK